MKRLFFLIWILPSVVKAQDKTYRHDSVGYYQRQLSRVRTAMYDSLRKNEEYKLAMERLQYYRLRSDNYSSFVLLMDIADADFDKFNAVIAPKNFEPLEGPVYRFGFGMSVKNNRTIVDFILASSSLRKLSGKTTGGPPNSSIKSYFSNGFIIDIGYDFIKHQRFNFYPYAGLSLRTSYLYFQGGRQLNPAFSDITNIVLNDPSADASSVKLGYQAGIGAEIVTSSSNRGGGGIFFIKAGINRPVGKEVYRIGSTRYNPGIEYGKWIVTFGIKFFGRT